jgi:hypothetical protein
MSAVASVMFRHPAAFWDIRARAWSWEFDTPEKTYALAWMRRGVRLRR